jgi:hypothetical protein
LEHGVGEGLACGGGKGGGEVKCPCSVERGNGCLAAQGGLVLMGVGGLCVGVGVEPEAMHFFPMVGAVQALLKGPSKARLMPRELAVDMK